MPAMSGVVLPSSWERASPKACVAGRVRGRALVGALLVGVRVGALVGTRVGTLVVGVSVGVRVGVCVGVCVGSCTTRESRLLRRFSPRVAAMSADRRHTRRARPSGQRGGVCIDAYLLMAFLCACHVWGSFVESMGSSKPGGMCRRQRVRGRALDGANVGGGVGETVGANDMR